MDKNFLTVPQLADLLGIAKGTVYNRVRFGDLPVTVARHYFGQGRKSSKGGRLVFNAAAVSCWRTAYQKKWKS